MLFNSTVGPTLDDFYVSDYADSDVIPHVKAKGFDSKQSIQEFFHEHRHLSCIDIESICSKLHSSQSAEVKSLRQFPLNYLVHTFDTFIGVEIEPGTMNTEYLILSPFNENPSGLASMDGMTDAIAVTGLYSALSGNSMGEASFFLYIDQLLNYLMGGQRKESDTRTNLNSTGSSIAPEGYISLSEFSARKGIAKDKIVEMIRDGFYVGRKIEGDWFVSSLESVAESKSVKSGYQFRWWHIVVIIAVVKIMALIAKSA